MTLVLKPLQVTANQDGSFTVQDVTLIQSATNPGGYAGVAPYDTNPAYDIIQFAGAVSLTISVPDTSTYLPSATNYVFNAVSTPPFQPLFPNINYSPFNITADLVGGIAGQKLPDGIYQFDYTIVFDGVTYTSSVYALMNWNTKCCIAQLASSVDWKRCSCDGTTKSQFEKGWTYLWAADASMLCQNITNAAAALLEAAEVCDGCGGCSC